jgi:hypothetical protein
VSALPEPTTFLAFGLVALGMVCSPGPNMIYLVSRSIAQGRRAGMVSLLGVAAGFPFYLLLTCLGLAAVFGLVPAAYTALKWAGAAYLRGSPGRPSGRVLRRSSHRGSCHRTPWDACSRWGS